MLYEMSCSNIVLHTFLPSSTSAPTTEICIQIYFQSPSLNSSTSDSPYDRNVVGELQNLAAKNRWELPVYKYEEPTGQAHSKTFTCLVKVV